MKNLEFVGSVVLTVLAAVVIAVWVPGNAAEKLKLSLEYGMLILLFLFAFLILAAIASGKIDISKLITEEGGGASMSRFQLLIFTFVIGLSFFLVVVCDCRMPDIPANVLALLGISATTYGVSKGIQASGGLKGKTGTDGSPGATSTAS